PIIGINDASNDNRTLAESSPLPQGTSDWQNYSVEFSTSGTTNAVYVNMRRKVCSAGCPITGHLWVDNFVLQKLSETEVRGQRSEVRGQRSEVSGVTSFRQKSEVRGQTSAKDLQVYKEVTSAL